MEKECFENEQIAQYLNEHFVSIKVDREERPDVDKLYMSFIQAMSGAGGWPMTVFLTPDLDPITGGTYFPPHDSPGSMGLPSVLRLVTENWSDKRTREAMGGQGKMITDALRKGYGEMSHPGMTSFIAIVENESRARTRYNLLNRMILPCGPPPEKSPLDD
ncbi:splicing factor 3B subunit 10 [Ancylostoma duodenale]|uniref:Splicing factor 3B subunit 10 n=1 Tax=Ancylostoma duodenale TaxID=51022 RepID=A0A0C2HAD9_9BILA|nr:splicing factor 3B subunit 10 [Ancylostoma duodenale]